MNKKQVIFLFLVLAFLFYKNDVYAYDINNYRNRALCGTYELANFNADGSIQTLGCYDVYETARDVMKTKGDNAAVMAKSWGEVKIIDANQAIVNLAVKSSGTTDYFVDKNLQVKYTYMDNRANYAGVDGALVDAGYSPATGQWVAFVKIANVTAWVSQSDFEIVPLSWVKSTSYYSITDEGIRHNYVNTIKNANSVVGGRTIGPKPEQLTNGNYYSYDGHYFYKDLKTMLNDYRKYTFKNSVNYNNMYYNYYQYLSNHTRTNYSSVQINEYIKNNLGLTKDVYGWSASSGTSRLYNSGTWFYYAQEKYGVNAVLALSLSRNETGNGQSDLAINKNNGFGLNAVDSNPIQAANWYPTFANSILGFAMHWVTDGYAHPRDWRYFGPQFGDKYIGMNVQYASDAYWSEKMAANYYGLDKALGLQDYNYYQLGVLNKSANAYNQPSTSSKWIYKYTEAEDSVVIVSEKTVNNELWYEVVSDLNVDNNYNEVKNTNYNWNKTVWVKASDIKKINKAKNGYKSPNSTYEYPDKDYEFNIYVENSDVKPKVAISTKETAYYNDPTFTKATGQKLLKDKYIMVYAVATLNGQPKAYLVTSDYKYDQKHWVAADSIQFKNMSYGRVDIFENTNVYTWITSRMEDKQQYEIGGLYTYTFIPIISKQTVGSELWYTVPVDPKSNTYNVGYTLGNYPTVKIYLSTAVVENQKPVINAVDKTIKEKDTFDPKANVTATDAEDGNITSKIQVTENTVNTNTPGTYKVTYKVTDSANNETIKTITVTVVENKAPVITANNITITQRKTFDPKKGVTATDEEDGDLTSKITVKSNTTNINTPGTYKIVYEVIDNKGKATTKEITVTVEKDEPPVINAKDITIGKNTTFDPKNNVTATDKEDKDLTSKITIKENTVNTKTIGTYKVTYEVIDSFGNKTNKTINVKVEDKVLTEKESIFYLDYLKEVNSKLEIKGYNSIKGINNNLDVNIKYYLLFKSLNNTNEYKLELNRITDKSEITRPIYSTDNLDYTYSWFKGSINTTNIPDGDYEIYIVSESPDYYSKTIISNKLLKPQVATYKDTKYILTRNNYLNNELPLELVIRSTKIGDKTATSTYNQYSQYRALEFTSNKLHIKGNSYSYGMDLSKSKTVERKIIFENTSTYQKYEYDLSYIDTPLYQVGMTLGDNLDKTRAWFDKTIDISNIPKGNYAIYITTKSNISDYGELNELLLRNVTDIKATINSKEYSFIVNNQKRFRIELNVK